MADSAFPSYQPSAQPPLASGKVRFVGEPIAMAFAPTRALAGGHRRAASSDRTWTNCRATVSWTAPGRPAAPAPSSTTHWTG
ncbi:hypothetical protein ACU4GD_17155 [Cupriavidus basilensis]